VYAMQIMTSGGWVTTTLYPSRSTAYRRLASRRLAYPLTQARVVQA
jgi:hypothetical protein